MTQSRAWYANQALQDAQQYAVDVRDIDPRQVWDRTHRWMRKEPTRLAALVTILAAMVPVDVPTSELLAWTTDAALNREAS